MSENLSGRGPHIFTEQGPIGFKSGPDYTYVLDKCAASTVAAHETAYLCGKYSAAESL